MVEYDEVWERFRRERRLEFGGHMDLAWRGGHSLSASLMIRVDTRRYARRLEPLRAALRPFPFVSLHPDRFMHVTLVLLGFLVEEATRDDEVSRERLKEIEKDARNTLRSFPPFEARLANLNAFPGAAFVEVHDGGRTRELREALCNGCGIQPPPGSPHLTLAYFQAPDGTPAPEELISAIERLRDWPVGELRVEAVELTLLDLGKGYPAPETAARMPLGAGG
ncbi:MAG: 2'-5' RNA ligase family protein [Actinomycetota bacterium]